jgi:hypothetical protein
MTVRDGCQRSILIRLKQSIGVSCAVGSVDRHVPRRIGSQACGHRRAQSKYFR